MNLNELLNNANINMISIAAFGYFVNMIKGIPLAVFRYFQKYLMYKFEITKRKSNKMHEWELYTKWINQNAESTLKRTSSEVIDVSWNSKQKFSITFFPNGTYQHYLGKLTWMTFSKEELKQENQYYLNDEKLTIYLIGFNAKNKFKELLNYYDDFMKTLIRDPSIENDLFGGTRLMHTYNNIFNNEKYIMKDLLEKFIDSRNWYKEKHLIHKIGLLLYGPPGTGKTSTIKAVCSELKLDVTSLDLVESPLGTVRNAFEPTFNHLGQSIPKVVILEEIDLLTTNRKKEDILSADKLAKEGPRFDKLKFLLNVLDGVYSDFLDNIIIIATTNFIDRLDEALIRDGRFNTRIEMNGITMKEIVDMANYYKVDLNNIVLPEPNGDLYIPATIQKLIIDKAIENKLNGGTINDDGRTEENRND